MVLPVSSVLRDLMPPSSVHFEDMCTKHGPVAGVCGVHQLRCTHTNVLLGYVYVHIYNVYIHIYWLLDYVYLPKSMGGWTLCTYAY